MSFKTNYHLDKDTLFAISFVILVLLIILLIDIIQLIIKSIRKKYTNLVSETSERFRAIEDLNSRYVFNFLLKDMYFLYWDVDTKQKFDRFNFRKNFKEEIASRLDYYTHILSLADHNYFQYQEYSKESNTLPAYTSKGTLQAKHCNFKRYSKYEHQMCKDAFYDPITELVFRCSLNYTSPAGRNSYNDYEFFNTQQIADLLDEIRDDERRKTTAAYQRSLMTQSMRYDVLKRDGFKCVLCGRGAKDGVELQVDHILPVSKGGKTLMSNLRTLCSDCNSGKSAKFDKYGLN